MDLAVIDADVLIHLAKLNKLNLLKTQFSQILKKDITYHETVIQGLSAKRKDAITIKESNSNSPFCSFRLNKFLCFL
jgi:hypothetical protein